MDPFSIPGYLWKQMAAGCFNTYLSSNQNPGMTFQHTGWLVGILRILAYDNPGIYTHGI